MRAKGAKGNAAHRRDADGDDQVRNVARQLVGNEAHQERNSAPMRL